MAPHPWLELELKTTKEKCNSHSVPVSFSRCHAAISRKLRYVSGGEGMRGSKQLDESLASQSLVLNIASVFI